MNVENRDVPTVIKYEFRLSDYFQKIGDELYVNLNLNKDFYNEFITESRKTPKELDYKYVKKEYIEMSIPTGYSIDYLPENAKHDGGLLGYEITYQVKGTKVIFCKTLYVDYLLMQPEEFEKWNESVKAVSEAYKESIIFKKK
jgi:hypothetical protein